MFELKDNMITDCGVPLCGLSHLHLVLLHLPGKRKPGTNLTQRKEKEGRNNCNHLLLQSQ